MKQISLIKDWISNSIDDFALSSIASILPTTIRRGLVAARLRRGRRELDALRRRAAVQEQELRQKREKVMFELLGRLIADWALLEMAIDLVCRDIFNHDQERVINRSLPVSLKDKLTFWRKAHHKVTEIYVLRQEGEAIAKQIEELKDIRHDFAHGIVLEETEWFRWNIARPSLMRETLGVKERSYSTDDVLATLKGVRCLTERVFRHWAHVGAAIRGESVERFIQQLSSSDSTTPSV